MNQDMAKKIIYGEEARKALYSGIKQVADAVGETLGPTSNNVCIESKWGTPKIIHDGVTVAEDILLKDRFENLGAQLVKEAARKTNDESGDGTTTCTLLTEALVREGNKLVAAGVKGMSIRWELEKAKDLVVKELTKLSQPVNGKQDAENVATVSSGDPRIGKIIAEALDKVGKVGVVDIQEGSGWDISLDYKEGMQIDRGYSLPFFVTNEEKGYAEHQDVFVLLADCRIDDLEKLLPLMEKWLKNNPKPLLILAEDFNPVVQVFFTQNFINGKMKVLPVRTPEFADRRTAILEDIAALTGATVINPSTGKTIESIELSDLGRAEKVWADASVTKVVGGLGKEEDIKKRVDQIKNKLDAATSDYEKEKLMERMARLTSGVAVISVGARSATEMNEIKERVKDAVGATRAALAEGIVPGGGITLLKVSAKLKGQTNGEKILKEALRVPVRRLFSNAGYEAERVMVDIENKDGDYGFNVITGKFGSMYEAGVIDPVKVLKSAIESAVSHAAMAITTNCLIVEDKPEKPTK